MLNLMDVMNHHVQTINSSFDGSFQNWQGPEVSSADKDSFQKMFLRAVDSSDSSNSQDANTDEVQSSSFKTTENYSQPQQQLPEKIEKDVEAVLEKYVNPNSHEEHGGNSENEQKGSLFTDPKEVKKAAQEMVAKLKEDGVDSETAAKIVEKIFQKLGIKIKINLSQNLSGKNNLEVSVLSLKVGRRDKSENTQLKPETKKVLDAVSKVLDSILEKSGLSGDEKEKLSSFLKDLKEKLIEFSNTSSQEKGRKAEKTTTDVSKLVQILNKRLEKDGLKASLSEEDIKKLSISLQKLTASIKNVTSDKAINVSDLKGSLEELLTTGLNLVNKISGKKVVSVPKTKLRIISRVLSERSKKLLISPKITVKKLDKNNLKEVLASSNLKEDLKKTILENIDEGKIAQLKLKKEKKVSIKESIDTQSLEQKVDISDAQLKEIMTKVKSSLKEKKLSPQTEEGKKEIENVLKKEISQLKVEVPVENTTVKVKLSEVISQAQLENLTDKLANKFSQSKKLPNELLQMDKLANKFSQKEELELGKKIQLKDNVIEASEFFKVKSSSQSKDLTSLVKESFKEVMSEKKDTEAKSEVSFKKISSSHHDDLTSLKSKLEVRGVSGEKVKSTKASLSDSKLKDISGKVELTKKEVKLDSSSTKSVEDLKKKFNLKEVKTSLKKELSSDTEKLASKLEGEKVGKDFLAEGSKVEKSVFNHQENNVVRISTQEIDLTAKGNFADKSDVRNILKNKAALENFQKSFTKVVNNIETNNFEVGKDVIKIKLYPKNLGEIKIEISKNESGIAAKIISSSAEAKSLFESSLDVIKHAFEEKGITLSQFSVVNSKSETSNQFSQNGNGEFHQGSQSGNQGNGSRNSEGRREGGSHGERRENSQFVAQEKDDENISLDELMRQVNIKLGRVDYWI